VVDALCAAFPGAQLNVIVGPKAGAFFSGNPHVAGIIPFNKHMGWLETLRWFAALRRQRFDLVVDLRNSFLPFLLRARTVTRPVLSPARTHMKDRHLARLGLVVQGVRPPYPRCALVLSPGDRLAVGRHLAGWKDYVVVAPGAADARKRWSEEGFARLLKYFYSRGKGVVMVGDTRDHPIAQRLMPAVPGGVLDLCGRTSLLELAGILEGAALALTNDSGVMHLASYLDRPVVALFGPTDPFFYGPWSSSCAVVRAGGTMAQIRPEDVVAAMERFL
jgi:ADP-heptose:LPS heptosyltransferase